MADITTDYLGIKLKNPIVAGACNLWTRDKNIAKAEKAGAAALVYKSLFEEQIQLERMELDDITTQYDERHAMMTDVFPEVEHAGPQEHLERLKEVKEMIEIPLIASLNAVNEDTWIDYSKRIEDTGVDAIELNFFASPQESERNPDSIEKGQLEILEKIKKNISIPISVKLSYFYTNVLNTIKRMDSIGIDGFVIFNRLFQPDIDIKSQKHIHPFTFSGQGDYKLPLRFAGLLFGEIKADICGSSGIFDHEDMIKMILAGSKCVQVVSTIYKNGSKKIDEMVKGLSTWMDDKDYDDLDSFRGKLSNKKLDDPFIYQRAQYVDMLMKSGKVIKDRPI